MSSGSGDGAIFVTRIAALAVLDLGADERRVTLLLDEPVARG